jgi:hypothetical protein
MPDFMVKRFFHPEIFIVGGGQGSACYVVRKTIGILMNQSPYITSRQGPHLA